MLVHWILSQRSLRLSSVLFILFTLFCFSEVISSILSSSSLMCSSASDILLLIPFTEFLISVIVLSLYVYFLVLLGFLTRFLHFLHFVFKVFDIFSIIILNPFSGLPISSSFIWTSVSSLFLHLCSISLPFHYFFSLLYLKSPFPRLNC